MLMERRKMVKFSFLRAFLFAPGLSVGIAFAQPTVGPGGLGAGPGLTPGVPASGGTFPNGFTVTGSIYYATNPQYGSCVWGTTASNDAGPCINAAFAACAAAKGGNVIVPAGQFNLATPVVNSTSGCSFSGQGAGIPRASNIPGTYLAVTRFIWTGTAGATMFQDYAGSAGAELYWTNVVGIVFDCASLANVCAEFRNVSYSTIAVGAAEPRITGIAFDTDGTTPGPGNQNNEMWLYSRSTSPSNTYSPTGILLDQGASANFNTSFNRINILSAWFAQGDGIVVAGTDNNDIFKIETSGNSGNDTGRPVVFANDKYVMANGVAVNGKAYDNKVYRNSGPTSAMLGFQSGSTFTAGTNTGSAALNPISISTNNTTAVGNATLNFASTTGLAVQMSLSCGGFSSGVMSGARVLSLTASTVVMWQGAQGAVANSTPCVFTYGITNSAVAGTYTLTATDGTHWNITAPSGGHSQSAVAIASGILTFTDLVVPLTGTPNANDTFTVVVPNPTINTTFESLDKANNAQDPMLEAGSNFWLATTQNPIPSLYGGTGSMSFISKLAGATGASGSFNFGLNAPSGSAATGQAAMALGGLGNSATGLAANTLGGHANVASGNYSLAMGGETNTADGTYDTVGGANAAARGRFNVYCQGAGKFSANGDAQSCVQPLRGTGTSTGAIQLTSDGGAAGSANCVNIPNNSSYSILVNIMAFDHTTVTKNETWQNWGALLTRGANAASTAIVTQSTPTPLTNGTLTGSSIAMTADTTNGCLNISFTPPSSNSDTWNVVAYVQTVETQ